MHAVVMESLEDYLAGSLEPSEVRVIEAHLNNCDRCREEIRGMQEVSLLFSSLKSETGLEASPAFYSGVIQKAGVARSAPSFASFFRSGVRTAPGVRVSPDAGGDGQLSGDSGVAGLGGYFSGRDHGAAGCAGF